MQLKAVHTIHRTTKLGKNGDKKNNVARVAPVVEEILPGKKFTCSDADGAYFLKIGAAARLDDDDAVPAPQPKEPAKPKAKAKAAEKPSDESSLSEEKSESSAGDSDTTEGGEDDLVG